jgi:3-oxoacyl-[acyl-carrier protein] reductase
MNDSFGLAGKTALVTGGAGGIGAAVCRRLLQAGVAVTSADLPGRASAKGAFSLDADLRDPGAPDALVAAHLGRFQRLDLVVHAAGIARDAMLWKMDDAAWDDVLAVNLAAGFRLLRAAIPAMRAAGGGAVVLLASINGERGKAGQANYAASKAGLIALGRTAAREGGRFGIRVNVIAPGWIETAMTATLPEEVRDRARQETALGKLGQPEDVASAALFLLSPLAGHVTGQVLRVDGGQLTA